MPLLMRGLKLDYQDLGHTTGALAIASGISALFTGRLSDRIGRKPVMLMSAAGAFAALWIFMDTGPRYMPLILCLLVTLSCLYALLTLTVGPITAESDPATLVSIASGLIIGVGEVFGGGLAPALAGYLAKHFGIQHRVLLPLCALAIGTLAVAALNETAPARLRL